MTYSCKILQADSCHTWPGHGLGEMSLKGCPFEKIALFAKKVFPPLQRDQQWSNGRSLLIGCCIAFPLAGLWALYVSCWLEIYSSLSFVAAATSQWRQGNAHVYCRPMPGKPTHDTLDWSYVHWCPLPKSTLHRFP